MITLVVGNTNTSIYEADPWSLSILDKELRYPTATAQAVMAAEASGSTWKPPASPGAWDGWIRLLKRPRLTQPHFPTGLVARVTEIFSKMQIPYRIDDARQRPMEGMTEFPPAELADRHYQRAAIDEALRVGRGVLVMAPRSGKTRTMMAIVAKLGLPALWTAPTDAIVQQTMRAFEKYFGKNFAYHQKGSKDLEKAMNARVVLCTAATAVMLPPELYQTREVLIADEAHHLAAKTHRDIMALCDHIYFRFGMSGTFFRSGDDSLAMHALLSNVIYRVDSAQLLKEGYLVPTRVVYVPVDAPRLRCPSDDHRVAPHVHYGIREHEYRNGLVAYCAAYLHNHLQRKVLVLVATKSQGRRLCRLIQSQVPERAEGAYYNPVEFISTDRRRETQQAILKAYIESDEVRILIGTSLVGEGVDLPPADALVYARGEKAEVMLTQNVYRVCTAWEGKRDAIIVDFADRHSKKLMKHSHQRLGTFYRDPIFDVEVLPSIKHFGSWCRKYASGVAAAAS